MLFKSNISGYEVTYCNITGVYQILDGEAVIKESKSFPAIEKYIETGGKKKEKKQRLEKKVIFCEYGEYKEAIITSMAEESKYGVGHQVWFMIEGKRKKEYLKYFFDYNKENWEKIAEINLLNKQKDILGKNIATIHNSLTTVTLAMLVDESK